DVGHPAISQAWRHEWLRGRDNEYLDGRCRQVIGRTLPPQEFESTRSCPTLGSCKAEPPTIPHHLLHQSFCVSPGGVINHAIKIVETAASMVSCGAQREKTSDLYVCMGLREFPKSVRGPHQYINFNTVNTVRFNCPISVDLWIVQGFIRFDCFQVLGRYSKKNNVGSPLVPAISLRGAARNDCLNVH